MDCLFPNQTDIHEDIVSEHPDTSPGIQSRGDVEFALEYISDGSFGSVPETIYEKAFPPLRHLVEYGLEQLSDESSDPNE